MEPSRVYSQWHGNRMKAVGEELLEAHMGKRGITNNTVPTRSKNRPQQPPRTIRKTNLKANFRPTASQHQVQHLGDALSSLLFCSGLNPFSQVMNKTG